MVVVATRRRHRSWRRRVLHSFASCLLTPAIAALTLKLCGHEALQRAARRQRPLRLARQRLRRGAAGRQLPIMYRSVRCSCSPPVLTVPALLDAAAFRTGDRVADDHPAMHHPRERRRREHRPWHIFREPTLHVFAVCVVLFQFANAAMLPLALNELAKRIGAVRLRGLGGDHRAADRGGAVLALGRPPRAEPRPQAGPAGRLRRAAAARPAVRDLPDAVLLVAIQVLDGVSATVFGLTMPLIAADVTRSDRLPEPRHRLARSCWPPASAPPPARRPPAGWPTILAPPSHSSRWRSWAARRSR